MVGTKPMRRPSRRRVRAACCMSRTVDRMFMPDNARPEGGETQPIYGDGKECGRNGLKGRRAWIMAELGAKAPCLRDGICQSRFVVGRSRRDRRAALGGAGTPSSRGGLGRGRLSRQGEEKKQPRMNTDGHGLKYICRWARRRKRTASYGLYGWYGSEPGVTGSNP